MKHRTNIPALLLAILVFIASNGIALSEHICNTSNSSSFSIFTSSTCNKEKPATSCCAKMKITKKDCCEHKQFFSKLPLEAFVAKQIELKPFEKFDLNKFHSNFYSLNYNINFNRYISGIPPPDNLYTIKYFLRPTPVELQVFRC